MAKTEISSPKKGFRPTLWTILYFVFIITVEIIHFESLPLPNIFQNLLSVFFALFVLLTCFSLGQLILNFILKDEKALPIFWNWILSFGIGFDLLGTVVFILGWVFPGNLSAKIHILYWILVIFFLLTFPKLKNSFGQITGINKLSFSLLEIIYLAIGAIGFLISFTTCFSPITYYDSLVYHLALPKYYLQQGFIGSVSHNLYSQFPALTEMIYLFCLDLFPSPEYVINLITWTMSLFIGMGLYFLGKEKINQEGGFLCWALWGSMPAVLFLSVGAYIEVPLAFFTFLALYAFWQAKSRSWDFKWLILSGIFAGAATSIKYTGGLTSIILFLIILCLCFVKKSKPVNLLWFGVPALFPICLWFLKNRIEVGNPFFPFFYLVFKSKVGWTAASANGYFQVLTEYGSQSQAFIDLLHLPFYIFTHVQKLGGGFDVLGDLGWSIFILSAPVAIFFIKNKREFLWAWIYFVFHFLGWACSKPVFRFLFPLLPLMIILTSFFIMNMKKGGSKIYHGLILVFIAPFLISNFYLYFFLSSVYQPFSVPFGLESRQDYLNRILPIHSFYDEVNKITLQNANEKIAILGDQRTYHLNLPYICSNIFTPSIISIWANDASSIEDLTRKFNENNVAYLAVNWNEIKRLGGYSVFGFTPKGIETFTQFLSKAKVQFQDKNNSLFNLKNDA